MSLMIGIGAIFLVVFVLAKALSPGKISRAERARYESKTLLLNKSELLLFNRLKETKPEMLVFSQVSMSQLFNIKNFRNEGYRQIGEIGR